MPFRIQNKHVQSTGSKTIEYGLLDKLDHLVGSILYEVPELGYDLIPDILDKVRSILKTVADKWK